MILTPFKKHKTLLWQQHLMLKVLKVNNLLHNKERKNPGKVTAGGFSL